MAARLEIPSIEPRTVSTHTALPSCLLAHVEPRVEMRVGGGVSVARVGNSSERASTDLPGSYLLV